MNYFVTGTDTNVGKTLVSCALLHGFAAQGKRVVGMKPVAAGCNANEQNDDVLQLRAASNVPASNQQINPYSFAPAIAPHLAAQRAGVGIDTARIIAAYRELSGLAEIVIVEGAGGFIVPLNDRQTGADLAQELGLPVIVVVGMRLGCINHALLTVRAIADYRLECAGWVANVLDADMPALQENIEALRQRIAAPLLGEVPYMMRPDARVAAGRLELDRLLLASAR
jgi:dethiobiotin synthetase